MFGDADEQGVAPFRICELLEVADGVTTPNICAMTFASCSTTVGVLGTFVLHDRVGVGGGIFGVGVGGGIADASGVGAPKIRSRASMSINAFTTDRFSMRTGPIYDCAAPGETIAHQISIKRARMPNMSNKCRCCVKHDER